MTDAVYDSRDVSGLPLRGAAAFRIQDLRG